MIRNNFLRDVTRRQRAQLERYGLLLIEDVAVEHISLAEARDHLSLDAFGTPPESWADGWLEAQIPAAREYCEQYLGRSLAAKTLEYATHSFPTYAAASPPGLALALPFGPVQEIVSVTYLDQAAADAAYTAAYDAEFANSADIDLATAAGDAAALAALEQTIDPSLYELDIYSTPALLEPAYGNTWPSARVSSNSVKVRYIAGYNIAGDSPMVYPLPKRARSAMLFMLAHLFANREAVDANNMMELPLGVQALLDFLPRERLGLA